MLFLCVLLAFWFVIPFAVGHILAQMANAWQRGTTTSPLQFPRFNPVKTAFLTGVCFEAMALAGFYYWTHYVK